MPISMRKHISRYEVILVDVDGTLYHRVPVRLAMAVELVFYALTHIWRFGELCALAYFRSLHNGATDTKDTAVHEQECYMRVIDRYAVSEARLHDLVQRWLIKRPLKYLRLFRNRKLIATLTRLQTAGIFLVLYSDYPTTEKAAVLTGLQPDYQFCASDVGIECFKPCKKGVEYILKTVGVATKDALMIGDQDKKDGASARAVGMDYLIIDKSRQARGILRI